MVGLAVVVLATAPGGEVLGEKGLARLEVSVANGDLEAVFDATPSVLWSAFMLCRACEEWFSPQRLKTKVERRLGPYERWEQKGDDHADRRRKGAVSRHLSGVLGKLGYLMYIGTRCATGSSGVGAVG